MRRATVSVKWQRDTFSPWECLASMSSFKEILKSKNLRLWVFRSCPLWRLKLLERKWKGEKADLCNCSFHSVSRVWLFCDTMECRPPGSSDHGIFQAKILEWVAISFSRGSSQSRVWTYVSCSASKFFTLSHLGSPNFAIDNDFWAGNSDKSFI